MGEDFIRCYQDNLENEGFDAVPTCAESVTFDLDTVGECEAETVHEDCSDEVAAATTCMVELYCGGKNVQIV